jgi:hypothetical protein
VNANKGRLDVWLIYRCETCNFTWNREVLERVVVGAVASERLRAFHENDRETSWTYAFAEAGEVPWRIDVVGEDDGAIRIEMPYPCRVRLDRLLAAALGVSRAQVSRRFEEARTALRRPARDGQVLTDGARRPHGAAAE